MNKEIISTNEAPAAIGTYSQAIKVASTVYLSGQIPLVPETMTLISDNFDEQTHQVFRNLSAVCKAAGGELKDIVKLNIYLTNLSYFVQVNNIMSEYFPTPYPARAAIGINELPKSSLIEIDGIMLLP